MSFRDHQPIVIEEFNGLWRRGDADSVPIDHFSDCENIQYIQSGFKTRDGLDVAQNIASPTANLVRIYNYITQNENTLLALDNTGHIYHITNNYQTVTEILHIAAMEDFGFAPYNGYAYITPFKSYGTAPNIIQKGLQSDFLYVYLGDGTTARKAAGNAPINGSPVFAIANDSGLSDTGDHLFGVCYETDTGYITAPSCFTLQNSNGTGFNFTNVPVSPDTFVVARRLVMTKEITSYNGDTTGYTYYFIPDGRIPNNTATSLSSISVFDADLLEDASHLLDNYSEIPAGVGLTFYHNRLCLYTTYTDISLVLVSEPGEPEAINQVSGLLVAPLDGNPLTNAHELRDILYTFKRNRTIGWSDNGDVPSSWPDSIIDLAIGCPVHGIATVVDSGSSSIDYLIIASYKGLILFNGRYALPELSFKIRDLWLDLDTDHYERIQIVNDSVLQHLYMCLPDYTVLLADYSNGLDPRMIRWAPWRFDIKVNTVALINTSQLILGSEMRLFS